MIVRSEGWQGLYHGLLPTLLRDVPEIAMQFFVYERLRQVCLLMRLPSLRSLVPPQCCPCHCMGGWCSLPGRVSQLQVWTGC